MWTSQYNYGVYISVKNDHKPMKGRKPLAHLKVFHPNCWGVFFFIFIEKNPVHGRRTTDDARHKPMGIGHLSDPCDPKNLKYGNT